MIATGRTCPFCGGIIWQVKPMWVYTANGSMEEKLFGLCSTHMWVHLDDDKAEEPAPLAPEPPTASAA